MSSYLVSKGSHPLVSPVAAPASASGRRCTHVCGARGGLQESCTIYFPYVPLAKGLSLSLAHIKSTSLPTIPCLGPHSAVATGTHMSMLTLHMASTDLNPGPQAFTVWRFE